MPRLTAQCYVPLPLNTVLLSFMSQMMAKN